MARILIALLSVAAAAATLLVPGNPAPASRSVEGPRLRIVESRVVSEDWRVRSRFRVVASLPLERGEAPPTAAVRVGAVDAVLPLRRGRGNLRVDGEWLRYRGRAATRGGVLRIRLRGSIEWCGEGITPRDSCLRRTGPVFDLIAGEVAAGDRAVPFAVGLCGWSRVPAAGSDRMNHRLRGTGLGDHSRGPVLLLVRPNAGARRHGRAAAMAMAVGEDPVVIFRIDGGSRQVKEPLRTASLEAGGVTVRQVVVDTTVPAPPGTHLLEVEARAGGGTARETLPFESPPVDPAVALDVGLFHHLEIRGDGRVWAWGFPFGGALGDDSQRQPLSPIPVAGPERVRSVAAGWGFSLAVDGEGVLWSWGEMDARTPVPRPTPMGGIPPVRTVSTGDSHAVLLLADGTVRSFGFNLWGALGDGTREDRSRPVPVPGLDGVTAVAAGNDSGLAVREDGSVWAWGWLDRDREPVLLPVRVEGLPPCRAVAASAHFLAVDREGRVWSWGRNRYGELGDGTLVSRNDPRPVGGLPPIRSVVAGETESLALDEKGRVWTWGGMDTSSPGSPPGMGTPLRPVPVPGVGPATAIGHGGWMGLAACEDGTVWVWGSTMADVWSPEGNDGELSLPVLLRRSEPRGYLPWGPGASFGKDDRRRR